MSRFFIYCGLKGPKPPQNVQFSFYKMCVCSWCLKFSQCALTPGDASARGGAPGINTVSGLTLEHFTRARNVATGRRARDGGASRGIIALIQPWLTPPSSQVSCWYTQCSENWPLRIISWLWAKSDSNCPALPLYQVLIWALREVFISSGQFWRHTNKHWVMQTTDSEVRIVTSCDVVTCAGCRCHMMSHDVTASANQRRVLTWQEPIKRKSQLYSNILFTEDFPHK